MNSRTNIRTITQTLALIIFSCIFAGCGESSSPSPVAPLITTQPSSITVTDGDTATFTVVATGTAPLAYQWKNGTTNVGTDSNTYTTPATVMAADDGASITCVITNEAGSVSSNPATLGVTQIPVITTEPKDCMVANGTAASFTVVVAGVTPLTYQWQVSTDSSATWSNVTAGVGGTTANYSIDVIDDGDMYRCYIENALDNVTSRAATITVLETYVIIELSTGALSTTTIISDLESNDIYKTTHLVLKYIPSGTFQMGNDEHTVNITKGFYIGVFEITQKQWAIVKGNWPSYFTDTPDKLPVESISWADICNTGGFLDTITTATSLTFRLPTEAEWEYACRAGTSSLYSYGDSPDDDYMWSNSNSSSEAKEVGTRLPNPWGLYDMHGNVWEWCSDWFLDTYYSISPTDDPTGPTSGEFHVLRGGSWDHYTYDCFSSRRAISPTAPYKDSFGFRVVMSLD